MKYTNKKEMYLNLCRIPTRYWEVSKEGISNTLKDKEVLLKILEHFNLAIKTGESFYFWGNYGSGKTSFSVLLTKSIFPISTLFMTADELTDKTIRGGNV